MKSLLAKCFLIHSWDNWSKPFTKEMKISYKSDDINTPPDTASQELVQIRVCTACNKVSIRYFKYENND